MTSTTIERPVQTCATCPLFNPEQGVRGWCSAFDRMAKPQHESTATCDQEIAAWEKETASQPQTPQTQPVDEFGQGFIHGRQDAEERLHPIYEEDLHEYARGYARGYQTIFKPAQQTEVIRKPTEWLVLLDNRWGVYQAWVGDRCIGHGATEQEAEQKARNYIATEELIHRQNAIVRNAYLAESAELV
ncbi:MAG: hypothetical protein JO235_21680 [Chroococcidiopsidaceae cyanobacterium CP_BM_RX_35]|nr:hypothetical protein [Chroococcidiopsidaceae cyanobacterium CP_BM_RX_35]